MNDQSTELIPLGEARPSLVSLGTMQANDAAELVKNAALIATQLKSVVVQAHLAVNIQGNEYVRIEGWTTLGMLLGCIPRELETQECENGRYISTVAFCRPDGSIVTQASAECGGPEDTVWGERQPFARRSMAQTRATGKAARLAFSWIMSLAGYAPTPAEEMESSLVRSEVTLDTRDTRVCTDKQAAYLKHRLLVCEVEPVEFLLRYDIKTIEALPFAKVNEALSWIEGQKK